MIASDQLQYHKAVEELAALEREFQAGKSLQNVCAAEQKSDVELQQLE